MKVLHVLRDLSRNGGVQRLIFDMAMSKKTDLHIDVMVTNREVGDEYIDELRLNGVVVHVVPKWNMLAHFLLYRKFDIVHAHLFPALYLVGMFARTKVYTEHSTTNNRRNKPLSRLFESWIYSKFDSITCITPEVQISLLTFLKAKDDKNTCVIYNGVDIEKFSGNLEQEKSHAGRNIAMIGSLTGKKDQETIIESLSILGAEYTLHLAGEGARRAELVNLAVDLGVVNQVIFHGLINDIPSFFENIDLYVQSSKYEGFGLAAVEAMAAGLPTLCADVPGLKELTGSELNLFPQGDSKSLADKIAKIHEDKEYRDGLISIGITTSNRFSLRNMNNEFHNVYKGLIK